MQSNLFGIVSVLSIRLHNMLEIRIEIGPCVYYQRLSSIYTHVNIWKKHHHNHSVMHKCTTRANTSARERCHNALYCQSFSSNLQLCEELKL